MIAITISVDDQLLTKPLLVRQVSYFPSDSCLISVFSGGVIALQARWREMLSSESEVCIIGAD